jgi:hypothetical protein
MSAPPPGYESIDEPPASTSAAAQPEHNAAQIHIAPAPDAIQFQKGYLGVDGETAAFEGEVQIKGIPHVEWDTV